MFICIYPLVEFYTLQISLIECSIICNQPAQGDIFIGRCPFFFMGDRVHFCGECALGTTKKEGTACTFTWKVLAVPLCYWMGSREILLESLGRSRDSERRRSPRKVLLTFGLLLE